MISDALAVERLVDRDPRLGAAELAARLVPPRRFAASTFDSYIPDPDHPSQAAAREAMRTLARDTGAVPAAEPSGGRWRRRASTPAPAPAGRPGRYLDGGFGVGKTHLLAAAYHETKEPAAYASFAKLCALIGFEGMEAAVAAFTQHRLLLIDEFELDDVANTLMMVTFMRAMVSAGVRIAASSNSLPDRLGEGRFSAEDFTREIAAIASAFDVLRIDGTDYRARTRRASADPFTALEVDRFVEDALVAGRTVAQDKADDLLAHLRRVHPVQFGPLLDGVDAVVIDGLSTLGNQGTALLFVALVDELYDAEVTVAVTGCEVGEVFDESYRHGGFRKKYGRAESRLSALLGEARARRDRDR